MDGMIDVAREACRQAIARGDSWADAVDRALSAAGYRTLDPCEYGAPQDTRLVAVVDDYGPVGIWCHDDGSWSAGPISPVEVRHARWCGEDES